jgi:cellulose biosynthesis protein BcsQ
VTTVALYSNKGGVGKTTTAVNLAYLAARAGAKTLICDLDPQSSTTYFFRVKPKVKRSAQGFIKEGKPIEKSIKGTDYENLDLLPADFTHRNLDITFAELKQPRARLRKILEPLQAEYEFIFLDCPPTINILAENIFNAADLILIPVTSTTLSVRTYQQLLSFLRKSNYGPHRLYAFFSMVDTRQQRQRELAIMVYKKYDHILKSPIPYSSEVEQMELQREPVPVFAPNSAAAKAYQALWTEIQKNLL